MSQSKKVVIGILTALVIACLCFISAFLLVTNRVVNQTMTKDPAKAATQAAEIAIFDLPDGFSPTYSFDLGGMKAVDFSGPGKSHIQLMQFHAKNYTDEEMKGLFDQANQSFLEDYGNMEVSLLEDREITIKGQTITAQIYEGRGANASYRQMNAVFEGDRGPVFLAYIAPPETWDNTLIAAFLASIR